MRLGDRVKISSGPIYFPSNSCWDKYFPYGGNRLYSYNKKPPYCFDCATVPQMREEERGNSESFSALSA